MAKLYVALTSEILPVGQHIEDSLDKSIEQATSKYDAELSRSESSIKSTLTNSGEVAHRLAAGVTTAISKEEQILHFVDEKDHFAVP